MRLYPSLFFVLSLVLLIAPLCHSAGHDDLNLMIEKGKASIEQGDYQAGIAVLETVLARDPDHPEALSKLLEAYDAYSHQLIEGGRFDQAKTYIDKMNAMVQKNDSDTIPQFTTTESKIQSRVEREKISAKAFLSDPHSKQATTIVTLSAGRERYNEAVKHYQKNEFQLAEQLLLESIEFDQTNPNAYELLGELASLKQDLKKAKEYYQKAFGLNPDPRLREKLERLSREEEIDKNYQQYSDEHFIIRYQRDREFEGSAIREYLRAAYRDISQSFGFYPKNKIPVLFYEREEFEALYGKLPHWLAAMYDGKIRLPVYTGGRTETDLKAFIYHELTHAFALNLSEMKCPNWLNEGLAQYFENQVRPIQMRGLELAVQNKSLISTDELLFKEFYKVPSHDTVTLYYLEVFSLTTEMINRFGMYKMKVLLAELGRGQSVFEAFEKVFGRSFKDFSGEWQRDLERRYSK
ncbi:MAG: hypothetical protein HY585_03245 [Candidatus Omnitrophica bacterium]|nr:hypothetical protein [Candidatus Omnitrophota bacterium]